MVQRVSSRFLSELHGSHRVYSYVDAFPPDGSQVRLRVFTGSVNVDRTAQFRRGATMTCVDPSGALVPSGNSGALTPFGTEIRPYRGLQYADGTTEVTPLGVFRLSQSTIVESGMAGNPGGGSYAGTTISLTMYDRSRTISRDQFTQPWNIPIGTNIVVAIQQVLGRTFANLTYDAISTTSVTTAPQVFNVGDDPWVQATALATSIGCELYFDATGEVVIAPAASINSLTAPDFTYIEGQGNTMTDLQANYTDASGYNGVFVTGASIGNTSAAIQAFAWDTNPASPTYYLGPYGRVPKFVSDPNITTLVQAQAAAASQLAGLLGVGAQLIVTSAVNPSYEPGDTIQVVRSPLNISGTYLIDAFTVPLGGQIVGYSQSLTLRQKQG